MPFESAFGATSDRRIIAIIPVRLLRSVTTPSELKRRHEASSEVGILLDRVFREVVDNGLGPGIPEADRNRVLDGFYRAGNAAGLGSGLRLAVAAKVAVKHRAGFSVLNRTDGQVLKVSVSGLHRAPADSPAVATQPSSSRPEPGRRAHA
jgi:Osmosensitive K+ channel histidine kinase